MSGIESAAPAPVWIPVVLALAFGAVFFVVEFYDKHEHLQWHPSVIAGISIAYFFLIVLPEISANMPEFPLQLELLEYLFVLVGFAFIHVSEKVILQRVEGSVQQRVRTLLKQQEELYRVEDSLESLFTGLLREEETDVAALKHLVGIVAQLNEQETTIRAQVTEGKATIEARISRDLDELRFFTNVIFAFIEGLILISLLVFDMVDGVLFFFFALFRTIISNRAERDQTVFSDLDIHLQYHESRPKKLAESVSPLVGVAVGLIIEFLLPSRIELELVYMLFSFISGVILYTIVREVIPEKEKGSPHLFVLGLALFTVTVLLVKALEHTLF